VSDSLAAISASSEPASSYDNNGLRFTWWDHQGTSEWVEYNYKTPKTVKEVSVYWFDDSIHGQCRVPQSWVLQYKAGNDWKAVENPSDYGVATDKYNTVTFTPVTTTSIRIAVQLRPGYSGGVLRWRVGTNAVNNSKTS
jgi:hypothetical protein